MFCVYDEFRNIIVLYVYIYEYIYIINVNLSKVKDILLV